jgi:threonine/homoserine/homoserine lactone efflux protein
MWLIISWTLKPSEAMLMMDSSSLLMGFAMGFLTPAPIGPVSILCIRRTLSGGRTSGIFSGLGAATVDAFYGGVAGFELASISDLLRNHQIWLRLLGGVFLCALGARILRSKPPEHTAAARGTGLIGAYTSTLLLTLMNPITNFSLGFAYA